MNSHKANLEYLAKGHTAGELKIADVSSFASNAEHYLRIVEHFQKNEKKLSKIMESFSNVLDPYVKTPNGEKPDTNYASMVKKLNKIDSNSLKDLAEDLRVLDEDFKDLRNDAESLSKKQD